MIYIDSSAFMRSAQKIVGKEYPQKVVAGFEELATVSRNAVRQKTRTKFKLNSDYIPDAVKHLPDTPSQKRAAENAVQKYSDIRAYVYLRGAVKPSRSMDFMVLHEESGIKVPHEGNKTLAIPTPAIKRRSGFKTPRGRIRKRWLPETLLERFKSVDSKYSGSTTTNKGKKLGPNKKRRPGNAFMISGKGGTPMIARRLTLSGERNLEFLYSLKDKAKIDERWKFEPTVYSAVRNGYNWIVTKHLNKIKGA